MEWLKAEQARSAYVLALTGTKRERLKAEQARSAYIQDLAGRAKKGQSLALALALAGCLGANAQATPPEGIPRRGGGIVRARAQDSWNRAAQAHSHLGH